MSATQHPERDLRAEARGFLELAIRHCERLIAEGEREVSSPKWNERQEDAAHGAGLTLDGLRYALDALDRGDLEGAFWGACDRLCNLTLLIERTSDGFVWRDQQTKRGEPEAKKAASRWKRVADWIDRLKREEVGLSDRACLLRLHAEACDDPGAAELYFLPGCPPPDVDSFVSGFYRYRSSAKRKKAR